MQMLFHCLYIMRPKHYSLLHKATVRCDMRAHTFFHFFSPSSSTGSLAVANTSGGPERDMRGSFAISILGFAAQAVHAPSGLSQSAFSHNSWYCLTNSQTPMPCMHLILQQVITFPPVGKGRVIHGRNTW
jgi:hypothetical protein